MGVQAVVLRVQEGRLMGNIVRSWNWALFNCSEGFGVVGLCVGGGHQWRWEAGEGEKGSCLKAVGEFSV